MIKGICPKCHLFKKLTSHHIWPRRIYGENRHIIKLCRQCHDQIERLIPYRRMSKPFYKRVLKEFLKGGGYANASDFNPKSVAVYRQNEL